MSGWEPTPLPGALRWIAEHQPFTPVVETMRGLWMGHTSTGAATGHEALIAIAWCAAILAIPVTAHPGCSGTGPALESQPHHHNGLGGLFRPRRHREPPTANSGPRQIRQQPPDLTPVSECLIVPRVPTVTIVA